MKSPQSQCSLELKARAQIDGQLQCPCIPKDPSNIVHIVIIIRTTIEKAFLFHIFAIVWIIVHHGPARLTILRGRSLQLAKLKEKCRLKFPYFVSPWKGLFQGWTTPPRPAEKQAAPPRPAKLTKSAGRSGAKLTSDSIDTPFHYDRDWWCLKVKGRNRRKIF